MSDFNSMAELNSVVHSNKNYDVGRFHTYGRPVLAEFIGTTLFVFIGVLSAQPGPGASLTSVGLAHGLTIALLIMGLGKISGGHFNPAVSLGVCLAGGLSIVLTIAYAVAQILGGMLGAAFARAIIDDNIYNMMAGGSHIPNIDAGWAILGEVILTTILVLSVIMNAVNEETKNDLAPFAIGLAVAVDIMAAGGTTGASMNPARSFGPAVAASAVIPQDPWTYHYVYWVGPLGGSLLAAILHRFAFQSLQSVGKSKPNLQKSPVFSIPLSSQKDLGSMTTSDVTDKDTSHIPNGIN
ncbi:aquaporin-8-like [Ylistrum balloti]|uniref:aquaporin-8-like n=1 Tax=Ylistrum balloti TaxID=509963 RepID=UPI002905D700|nr:aquaporin-8-like [Ylistrum balloti]